MKRTLILTLLLFIFNLAAPAVFFRGTKNGAAKAAPVPEPTTQADAPTLSDAAVESDGADLLRLILTAAALMPAEYEPEAIAAQMLAVKTYNEYIKSRGVDAFFSQLPTLTGQRLHELWGPRYDEYHVKFESAAKKALSYSMTVGGKPFPAASFPLCAGKTEDSETIFGNHIPGLSSVPSDGDRLAPDAVTELTFARRDLFTALGLPADAEGEAEILETSDAGTVLRMRVSNKAFTGLEFSASLDLPGPAFSIDFTGGEYVVSVQGKGIFLGMSRYGADYMARQGADFKEILLHYFPEAEIKNRQAD